MSFCPLSMVLIYDEHLKRLIYLGYLLESETVETPSMGEKSNNKHKFGRINICEAEEVR